MRLTLPSILQGSLGSIIQRAIGGVNAMVATIWPFTYGASFTSFSNYAASTPVTVFSAASNVNGAILWNAQYLARTSGGVGLAQASWLAKTSAPGSIGDGDSILIADNMSYDGTIGQESGHLREPVFIAAGKGLYIFPSLATGVCGNRALYTLL